MSSVIVFIFLNLTDFGTKTLKLLRDKICIFLKHAIVTENDEGNEGNSFKGKVRDICKCLLVINLVRWLSQLCDVPKPWDQSKILQKTNQILNYLSSQDLNKEISNGFTFSYLASKYFISWGIRQRSKRTLELKTMTMSQ